MEQGLPIRCRAEEVADQLRLVVAGMPFLADRAWDEVGWGLMRIELLTLWRMALLLKPRGSAGGLDMGLAWVDRAAAPDGRCWEYGCQRDDWTLGPDSRLVEPLEFPSGEEQANWSRCCAMPAAGPSRSPALSQRQRWCWRTGSAAAGRRGGQPSGRCADRSPTSRSVSDHVSLWLEWLRQS